MHRLLTDGSLQVLVFVCVPLSLVLLALLVVRARHARTVATFPTFSVSISRVGRADAYVTYCDQSRKVEFYAVVGASMFYRRHIRMEIPRQILDKDVRGILSNLVLGLDKLRFAYRIYRDDGTLLADKGMTANE